MPKQYTDIRDKFAAKGMDYDEAQKHAAMIYNSLHPSAPMSPGHPEGMRKAVRHQILARMKKK